MGVLQASRRPHQADLYDEVAVLQGGRILEQGQPKKLWNRDGPFRAFAREQGVDSSKMSKPQTVADRVAPMLGWDVSPQEQASWSDSFQVAIKKPREKK